MKQTDIQNQAISDALDALTEWSARAELSTHDRASLSECLHFLDNAITGAGIYEGADEYTVLTTKRYRALQGVAAMAKNFLGFQSPMRATLLADAIKDLQDADHA